MRLTKCKIVGFKSFALSTTLQFDGSVVAIVGPNGCGKSNIVDAFRWVLGENSGHLRGERMEDVLFAGTEERKAQNIASVSLTFSGVKESLSLPFDELTISRTYHRDGESEYLINGKNARLKEVQMLFSGSGVGKDAFAIFEQGKLDQIIYLQPHERRKLFDEAAGVGRFLARKKESVHKLKEVEQNCLRIQDLHREGEKKVEKLQKQATLAEKNLKLQNESAMLHKASRFLAYRQVESSYQDMQSQLEVATSLLSEKMEEYQEVKTSCSLSQERLSSSERQRHEFQKQLWQLHTELKGDEVRLEEKKRRQEHLKREKERAEKQHIHLRKEWEELQSEKIEKNKETEKAKLYHKEKSEELEKARKSYGEKENELFLLEKKREEKQRERIILLEKVQSYALQIQETKGQLKVLEKELNADKLQMEDGEARKKQLTIVLEEKNAMLEKISSDLALLRKQLEENREKKQLCSMKKLDAEKEYQRVIKALHEEEAKVKALRQLEESKSGYSEGAKELIDFSKNESSPLFGKLESLSDLLSPHRGAERWVATALHIYADTLVVANKEDLHLVMKFAEEKKIKSFSLLCQEWICNKKALKGSLRDHVLATPISTHFLGRILVNKELSEVSESKKYVTENGFYVDENGVIFSHKAEGSSYVRKVELEEITKKLVLLKTEAEKADQFFESLVTKEKELQEEGVSLEIAFRKKEMIHLTEKIALQNKNEELKGIMLSLDRLSNKRKELEEEQKNSLKRISTLEKEYEENSNAERHFLHSLQELNLQFEKERGGGRADLERIQLSYQEAFTQEKQAISSLLLLEQNAKAKEEALKREERLLEQAYEESELLVQESDFLLGTLSQKREKILSFQAEAEILEKEGKNHQATHRKWEEQLNNLEKNIQQTREKKQRLELSTAHILSKKELLEKEGIEEVMLPALSYDEMKGRIEEIALLLQKSGAVNFAAIEELKKEEVEFAQINENLQDILRAKEDLEQTIKSLEQESKKTFKSHFQKIRTQFQHYFSLLFGGGEADLILQKEGDFFESGVEIHARPPGKKMQKISLLSGGERCLTALALLFAFFSAKPAPFCILDEVDAPLDDANVERFTNLLSQFTEETQFIVVTHNKKTMASADILIGVSMEEKGVSKLLSLSFEKQKVEMAKI